MKKLVEDSSHEKVQGCLPACLNAVSFLTKCGTGPTQAVERTGTSEVP